MNNKTVIDVDERCFCLFIYLFICFERALSAINR